MIYFIDKDRTEGQQIKISHANSSDVNFKEVRRVKGNHSKVGITEVGNVQYFMKQYTRSEHFDVEIVTLNSLREKTISSFFVDYVGYNRERFIILFPLLEIDLTSHVAINGLDESDLKATCMLMSHEINEMRKLENEKIKLRASSPFHFLKLVCSKYLISLPTILAKNPILSELSIMMRYDPQPDNFMIKDNNIYSIDFSMLRNMSPIYPFAFFLQSLIDIPRQGFDPKFIEKFFIEYIKDTVECPNGITTEDWFLLCRAEVVAHSVDWHKRRGQLDEFEKRKKDLYSIVAEIGRF